jgi:PleD family two-component response regulator
MEDSVSEREFNIHSNFKGSNSVADNKKSGYAVAVIDDLFFASKIREAAKGLGVEIDFIKGLDSIVEILNSKVPSLVIVDLNYKNVDTIGLIRKIKDSECLKGVHVIGYLPHVDTGLKSEAAEAGYDLVLHRSRFSFEMREILSRFAVGNDSRITHQ